MEIFSRFLFSAGEEDVYFAMDAERREVEAGCLNLSEKEAKKRHPSARH